MTRDQFLKTCACAAGACCFGSVGAASEPAAAAAAPQESGTSLAIKHERAQAYVKRLMGLLKDTFDEPTRVNFIRAMGARCAREAYGDKETAKDKLSLEDFLKRLYNPRQEDNVAYFDYYGGSGLKVSDGYCLCAITEKGPDGLDGLWCECSVGYVKYMFERFSTAEVENVELLESLKRGGKGCKFKITVKPA
jgi:hypothetical protein